MWFLFDAYERDLAWLRPGQPVEVTVPAVPGKTYTGTIVFIDPNVKEMTRSAKVRVELANPLIEENGRKRRELYHKLYAEGVVAVEVPEVLAIPRSAVLSPGGSPVVYVDSGGGAYERRRVRLGRAGDDYHEVLEGVTENERVVTQGNMLIDAQAQLNSNAGPEPGHLHGEPSNGTSRQVSPAPESTQALPPLTDSQRTVVKSVLELANQLTEALAADTLDAFNELAAKSHSAMPAFLAAFPPEDPWRPFAQRIEKASHLASAADLKAARKSFHPFSEAVVALVKALRVHEKSFSTPRIYRCPMTKDAFPGAPRTAEWMQMQPDIRNPYFGAEMLDCGSEVK